MNADLASRMLAELVSTAVMLCAPILGVTLLVGLLVSVLQVVTQIQEASLTFIPKLLAAAAVVVALGSWMLRSLEHYWRALWGSIPAIF